MASTTNVKIPLVYRALFIGFDILLPIMGIFLNAFSPITTLTSYTHYPVTPPNLETLVLLDGTSGFLAALAFLNMFFLLYRPNDILVWKALIGAVLLQDVFMLSGFARELKLRGSDWRSEDYGNIVGYIFIATVRSLFLLDLGLDRKVSRSNNLKAQ